MTGYFDDDSIIRMVNKERIMPIWGGRALLMQATHPVVFEGFFAHTEGLDDPYARLHRTVQALQTIIWGSRDDVDRLSERLQSIHASVRGTLPKQVGRFPAGLPYRADDPSLLMWVHGCIVDSVVTIYERYIRQLKSWEKEQLWHEYRHVGQLFGIPEARIPTTYEVFQRYMTNALQSSILHLTPDARALGIDVVLRPPAPGYARPLVEMVDFMIIGSLPKTIRSMYGFGWDPAREALRRMGSEYLKRVVIPVLPAAVRYTPRSQA